MYSVLDLHLGLMGVSFCIATTFGGVSWDAPVASAGRLFELNYLLTHEQDALSVTHPTSALEAKIFAENFSH